MLNRHDLTGCESTPLLSYLKAMGVLRILAEQKDPHVKGFWEGKTFTLMSSLHKEELHHFLSREYAPTPIVAPWNGGSGFYPGDATEGIDALLKSDDQRFATYRQVIKTIKSWPEVPSPPETAFEAMRILEAAYHPMKPGKKRETLEALVAGIKKQIQEFKKSSASAPDPLEIPLEELESLSKKSGSPYKHLWNAVRKARTECSKLERGAGKQDIFLICRARLPEECLEWLDAVYAIEMDGSTFFNPVLGTGGNEGRLDFSNNFMQRITELFIHSSPSETLSLLDASLFNTIVPGLKAGKVGQYDPGRAGGFNQGMGVETKDFKINPWDFVLMFEGALLLATTLSRRGEVGKNSTLSAPFTVNFSPVGFSSSEYSEQGRCETWLPVWKKPSNCQEVRHLFAEGRSTVGRRQARTGLDFTRAIASLGVDRGVESFQRYIYLVRRGQSYVALPAGKHPVTFRDGVDLLNEVDPITGRLDRFLREFKSPPASFSRFRRQIDEAIFACSTQGERVHFLSLLRALGRMERLVAQRDRSKKPALPRPLTGLSPRWLGRADDGSVELRIAAAVASICAVGKVGPLRSNLAGVDPVRPWEWTENNRQQFWYGSDLVERLSGVLSRRMLDSEKYKVDSVPLQSFLTISPHDAMPFLEGMTDDGKLEELLWGCTLIDWKKSGLVGIRRAWSLPLDHHILSRNWALLKLLHTPQIMRDLEIKKEPRIIHLLQGGRVLEANKLAIHRLKVAGANPFEVSYEEEVKPLRLLASLLIPVRGHKQLGSLVLGDRNGT